MDLRSTLRTDLVIAMTLAETFLLLLFVVWYSVTVAGRDNSPDIWKALAEARQKEIDRLHDRLNEQIRKVAELEARVRWWRANFNSDPPRSLPELIDILRSPQGKVVMTAVGRGYPPCEKENVLTQASVVRGIVRMGPLAESKRLRSWSAASGIAIPPPGAILSDWNSTQSFLSSVHHFYASLGDQGRCRFDYRLTYETKEDYYDGRETFERAFYAARISRARR